MRKSIETAGTVSAINTVPTEDNFDIHRDYAFTAEEVLKFKVDEGNRPSDINDATVKKYAKLMQSGEWFFEYSPIYVGVRSLAVFNGEHRRKAIARCIADAEKKGKIFNPTVYVRFVDDREKAKEKREALNAGKHWNCDDYIEAMVNEGNQDFIAIKNFAIAEDHPFLHSKNGKPYYNKTAICFGTKYSAFKKAYETGEFNLDTTYVSRAQRTYDEMSRIRRAVFGDDVSHDFWLNAGEAWRDFRFDPCNSKRIHSLPEGIETFFDELAKLGSLNSYKTGDWAKRYATALFNAENQ